MESIIFESGLVDFSVNDVRTIRFNPSDIGFAEELYNLTAKLNEVQKTSASKRENLEDDTTAYFDISRAEDEKMRDIVDSFFGEGFCADVFPGVRLYAMANGLTVIENFLFAVLDKMDEDVTANLAKRNDRLKQYTSKYKKYTRK